MPSTFGMRPMSLFMIAFSIAPEDAPVPGLDDDLVRLRDADRRQLVERRRRAVVVDVQALDERGGGAAGPKPVEVALHGLHGAEHLALRLGEDLTGHPVAPPV